MTENPEVELVVPTDIVKGDVIEDPARRRWLTVHEIRMLTDAVDGAYSFYGNGPDDRVTYEGSELVKRKRR
ncbi:hypothetical protein [[Mycobacterium] wendilense]|uniref:Uncharacterized protein n=1 Tax=[Mycobacterium] wendilense TaxID=3064284 RepID=A0ABM9MJD3_9MYCO|nr:hypothetical protein [Mycolicibacterium sp. MU0050]CAJ1586656.1 hypothetical protein MU0050_004389 [Mycolicibacterium sp. MU0050]